MSEKKWKGYQKLLIPLGHKSDINNLTNLASLLVDRENGEVDFLHVIREGSYSKLPREWRAGSKRVVDSHHMMIKKGISSNKKIITSESILKGVLQEAKESDAGAILLGWGPKPQSSISKFVSKMMKKAECDVIVFKTRNEIPEKTSKIIYPIAIEPNINRLKLISRIIKDTDAKLTFTHIAEEEKEENQEFLNEAVASANKVGLEADTILKTGSNVTDILADLSKKFELMILGPSRGWWLHETLFGKKTDNIATRANCSVLLHKVVEKE